MKMDQNQWKEMKKDAFFAAGHIRTEAAFREACLCCYLKHPINKAIHAASIVIAAALLALQIVYGADFYNVVALIAIVFSWVLNAYRIWKSGKIAVERDRESYGDVPVKIKYWIGAEQICVETSYGVSEEFALANVKYAHETKAIIVLVTKAKQIMLLDKPSFSKGTSEGFMEFLKRKNIKAI